MSHFPGHLRDAFIDWVQSDGMPEVARVEVDYEDAAWPARKLLGVFCHCTDAMPSELCRDLDIEPGSTYARAAQRLLRERRWPLVAR